MPTRRLVAITASLILLAGCGDRSDSRTSEQAQADVPTAKQMASLVFGEPCSQITDPVVLRVSRTAPSTVTQLIHLVRLSHRNLPIANNYVETLLSNFAIQEHFNTSTKFYFLDPFGQIRVSRQTDLNPVGEAHFAQTVAALAEAGVDLDANVCLEDFDLSIQDLLDSTESALILEEEVEWFVVAFTLYQPFKSVYTNRLGDAFTRSDLISKLTSPSVGSAACAGTHRLYALALLAKVDSRLQILEKDDRVAVDTMLHQASEAAVTAQLAAGAWRREWAGNNLGRPVPGIMVGRSYAEDLVHMTGHHLEWMSLLDEDMQLDPEVLTRAATFLRSAIDRFDDGQFKRSFCGISHGASSFLMLQPCTISSTDTTR